MKYLIMGASSTLAQELIRKINQGENSACGILHHNYVDNLVPATYIENCDGSIPDQVEQAIDEVIKSFGIPDHVINCTGVSQYQNFLDCNIKEWNELFDINFKSSINLVRYAGSAMKAEKKAGSFVIVGSGYGERHIPYLSSYCMSKGAIKSLVSVLSTELGVYKMRINMVTPGLFPSRMTLQFVENKKYIDQLIKHIPDGRLGDVSSVADAVLFLTSDAAQHINGANITIDGGMLNLVEGGIVR